MKNNPVITIIAVILVGAVAFFGGMKFQESKSSRGQMFMQQNGQEGSQNRLQQFTQGQRPVSGEIISVTDSSITVKMQDGSSKIIILSDKTTISKSAEGSKADLKEGERVLVTGEQSSDGSVAAESIQLNPMPRGGANGQQPNK